MTKAEAVAIVNGEKDLDSTLAPQDSQPEVVEEKVEPEVNTDTPEEPNSEVPKDGDIEDGKDEAIEVAPEKGDDNKTSKKKKYSPLEKQQYAFKLQKARWKKAEAALKEREEEITKLKTELEKYKGLTLEDFGNDQDKYTDYKLDQRLGQEKYTQLQKQVDDERRQMQMQEAAEIAEERLNNCFPDEGEREKYQNLIYNAEHSFDKMHPEIGFPKFTDFLLSEEDRSVIKYLQDSDNAPKLIRHFIHKPEAALKIMSMRNQYSKFIELKQLENRMMQHERIVANKAVVPEKKVLPDTGKTLNNNVIDTGIDWSKPLSKADAINLINKQKSL